MKEHHRLILILFRFFGRNQAANPFGIDSAKRQQAGTVTRILGREVS